MNDRRIGGHVSVAGGLIKGIERAQAIGANTLQIFTSAPLRWSRQQYPTDQLSEFQQALHKADCLPLFIHGCYLINLASSDRKNLHLSVTALVDDLIFCAKTGATGVIFHMGTALGGWDSHKETVLEVVKDILKQSPQEAHFIIENSAGSGSKFPATLEEMRDIRQSIADSRVRFCIDTAHAFAAGYDLRTAETVGSFAKSVEQVLGWDQIDAIHLNDSKIDLGKKNDRHENIGSGLIGKEGLQAFINHPFVAPLPLLLEVPGFEKNGPDKKNIEIVRNLVVSQQSDS